MTPDIDDDDVRIQVTAELMEKDAAVGGLTVELPPLTVMLLAGMIQLAQRVPCLNPPSKQVAGDILAMVRDYFRDCPAVLAVLAAGDDPDQDQPPRQRTSGTQTRH